MTHNILCVTDLDGTFVKNSVQIHPEDLEAYENCLPIVILPLTGRSVKEITYIAERNHLMWSVLLAITVQSLLRRIRLYFRKRYPSNGC